MEPQTFQYITSRIIADHRLNLRDIKLLLALCTVSDYTMTVNNLNRKQLGQIAGMAEDVVTRISARLNKLGWIRKSGNGGRSQTASYQLAIPQKFPHQIN